MKSLALLLDSTEMENVMYLKDRVCSVLQDNSSMRVSVDLLLVTVVLDRSTLSHLVLPERSSPVICYLHSNTWQHDLDYSCWT